MLWSICLTNLVVISVPESFICRFLQICLIIVEWFMQTNFRLLGIHELLISAIHFLQCYLQSRVEEDTSKMQEQCVNQKLSIYFFSSK